MAVALIALCLVSASACDQKPSAVERKEGASDAADGRLSQGHPAVPGRTMPCPRRGGLDNAGYPCEPNPRKQ